MIGGRFKVASLAAAGMLMGGVSAQAADLGGNCCADLEERVAELEATTARKGNRKVSLEVSGHVHESVVLWDDGFEDGAYIATSNYSRTRFRFKGSAKINADWSAGFLIEIGLRRTGNTSAITQGANPNGGDDIRHQALYLKSKSLGTVWLGHTSFAVDGVSDICLGCTISSSHEANLGWGNFQIKNGVGNTGLLNPTWASIGTGRLTTSNGSRDQIIRYISPTIAGFVFSADTQLDENAGDGFDSRWSAALRYAGEFGAIRVAGGIGYFEEDTRDGFGGSLSMQHTPTGLFIAGTYEEEDDSSVTVAGGRDTHTGWSVTGGVAGKWSSLGKTTLWVKYAEYDGKNASVDAVLDSFSDTEVLSLGINQQVDAAAMEVYVSYYHVTGDVNFIGGPTVGITDFDAVMIGTRIKF